MGRRRYTRALELLDRSAKNALRLGERAGKNTGWVDVLRERVADARLALKLGETERPLDKNRMRQKAEKLLAAIVEYVDGVVHSLSDEDGSST